MSVRERREAVIVWRHRSHISGKMAHGKVGVSILSRRSAREAAPSRHQDVDIDRAAREEDASKAPDAQPTGADRVFEIVLGIVEVPEFGLERKSKLRMCGRKRGVDTRLAPLSRRATFTGAPHLVNQALSCGIFWPSSRVM